MDNQPRPEGAQEPSVQEPRAQDPTVNEAASTDPGPQAPNNDYEPPVFADAEQASATEPSSNGEQFGGGVNLDMLLDVPITLSMEVGRTRVPIRNLLQLNPGSVIELDRLAGQPLDVFVNGTLIAHGEVVVVNEKFGVRLIDVVSPAERIRKLRS